ncbi:MAG: metallophosphoesterase [Bacteroidales bacterium]
MKRKTFHPEKFSFILSGIVFLFLCFKLLVPVGAFEINKIKIQINKPLESELKIVQISDLHLGSWLNKNRIQKMVDEVNNLEPDLIFITGDFVNYNSKETEPFGPILKKLKSKLGVFAILGNHDYGEYIKWEDENQKYNDFQELKHFIKSTGCTLLLNENIKIINNRDTVYIAGTENWGIKKRYPKKADLKKTLKNVNFEKPVLLLSHDPEFWRHFIKDNNNKTDITFSGHTHGGQVGNKNINQKIAKFLNIYLAGLYNDNNHQYLYVNSGIGFLGLPFRIGISPEITEFVVNKM